MNRDIFNTPLARELSDLLYNKLKESKNGELSFDEIIDIFQIKVEYGLRRVNGGAIKLIREKPDVEQVRDEKGKPYLKLI
jgi:predicted CopG family antitoxin